MIAGRTFPNQKVNAVSHGALFAGMLSDGIIRGCGINYSGKNITVSPGFFVLAGREIEVVSNETIAVSATSGYARVKARINTANASTAQSFEQFGWTVDYAASLSAFSALTKGDINGGSGTIYEAELCIVRIGGGNIAAFERKMGRAAARGVVWLDSDPGEGAAVPYADGVILAIS